MKGLDASMRNLSLIAMLGCALGCSSESTNTAGGGAAGGGGGVGGSSSDGAAGVHGVGDAVPLADYKITLVEVGVCNALDAIYPPKAGNVFRGASVLIQNTGSRDVPLDPFTVIDSAVNSYKAGTQGGIEGLGGCRPILGNSGGNLKVNPAGSGWLLPPTESVSGWVTFEIPEAATGLQLHFDPFVVGVGAESVTFNFGI